MKEFLSYCKYAVLIMFMIDTRTITIYTLCSRHVPFNTKETKDKEHLSDSTYPKPVTYFIETSYIFPTRPMRMNLCTQPLAQPLLSICCVSWECKFCLVTFLAFHPKGPELHAPSGFMKQVLGNGDKQPGGGSTMRRQTRKQAWRGPPPSYWFDVCTTAA